MNARGHFRTLQSGDIAHLAAKLRAADRDELDASVGAGKDVAETITTCVNVSGTATLIGIAPDGEPVSILGCASMQGFGAPWLLGTDRVMEFSVAFVREGRRFIAQWLERHRRLMNFVDARNDQSIAWLQHLGFEIHGLRPHPITGMPCHLFTMEHPSCANPRPWPSLALPQPARVPTSRPTPRRSKRTTKRR